eukprot:scaffold4957_cov152-Amphora_coffeaeformis.AAC.7
MPDGTEYALFNTDPKNANDNTANDRAVYDNQPSKEGGRMKGTRAVTVIPIQSALKPILQNRIVESDLLS